MEKKSKFKIALICGALAAAIFGTALLAGKKASAEGIEPIKGTDPAPAPVYNEKKVSDEFRRAYADLAFKLLNGCRNQEGEQVMISPLSVLSALGMTANGAKGETLEQMLDVLGGGMELEELNKQIYLFVNGLSSRKGAEFSAANALFVSPSFDVKDGFLNAVQNLYDAEVARLNFADAEKAAGHINRWCAEKTDGMIPKIVSGNDLNAALMMMLINALCFDAKWQNPYNSDYEMTKKIFHGTNGDEEGIFLQKKEHLPYLSGEHEVGFLKMYEGRKYAFAVLLPEEGLSLDEYLKGLTPEKWLSLLDGARAEEVFGALPRFKQETTTELGNLLAALGMEKAFSNQADFSAMGENVAISRVLHKTFIEVNNEGTRAAAITAVMMEATALPEEPKRVILDRPFVYAIIDTATNLPLFLGTLENLG